MEKPKEVQFRDLEHKKLEEAFERYEQWPDEEQEQALREAVANYVHAQALVTDRIQTMQIMGEIDGALAQTEAWKKTDKQDLWARLRGCGDGYWGY